MLSFSQRRQIRSRTCAHGMLPRRDFCGVLPLTQKKGPKDWLAGALSSRAREALSARSGHYVPSTVMRAPSVLNLIYPAENLGGRF